MEVHQEMRTVGTQKQKEPYTDTQQITSENIFKWQIKI